MTLPAQHGTHEGIDFDAKLFDLVAGARDRLSWSADEPRFSEAVAGLKQGLSDFRYASKGFRSLKLIASRLTR